MKKIVSLFLTLVLLFTLVTPAGAANNSDNQSNGNGKNTTNTTSEQQSCSSDVYGSNDNFVPGHILVVLDKSQSKINKIWAKSSFSAAKISSINDLTKFTGNAASNKLLNMNEFRQILDITLTDNTKQGVLDAIQALKNNPNIEYVGPDYIISSSAIPNDPYYGSTYQWGLIKINAPSAWDINTGSNSVLVGVLDTGIDTTNPDLAARVNTSLGKNFTDDTAGMTDPVGHGTKVAGIIGAAGNNGYGLTGVNWNVTLISERVLKSDGKGNGTGSISWIIQAINYAIEKNILILNFSGGWTGGAGDATVLAALKLYNDNNGVFICAAGNGTNNDGFPINTDITPNYPSSYNKQLPNVISVGSSDSLDNIASSSNYGLTTVDLFAPGVQIYTTYFGSTITYDSGTSLASPMVTGVAALMKSTNPSLTAAQIKSNILSTTDKVSVLNGKCVTGGRLNAFNAVKAVRLPVTITWNPDGGSVTPASSSLTPGAQFGTLPTPTKTGSTFGGWFTGTGGSGSQITSTSIVPSVNTTYYAKWTVNPVTITWNPDGGSVSPA
ncbi:MAG: S8 family serine peptidase, partial [Firmicutes bacterium]|nr:S8 family serine peptidase [Bacillota bacterium]